FDLSRDQLLDLIGSNAGPGANGKTHAYRYVWVFPLGHIHVTEHTKSERCEQCDPGNLTIVREEPCNVSFVVAFPRCHLTPSTRCPSLSRLAPVVTTSSPAASPLATFISLPLTVPSSTVRRRAMLPALGELINTNTPYLPSG